MLNLQAENSGFYGAVGFQYSNMTKATGSNNTGFSPLMGAVANPFLNQNGAVAMPTNPGTQLQKPDVSSGFNLNCNGLNCN